MSDDLYSATQPQKAQLETIKTTILGKSTKFMASDGATTSDTDHTADSPQAQSAALQGSSNQSAEDSINIAELRLNLYSIIATSNPGSLGAYSGFLMVSPVILGEVTPELIKERRNYLAIQERRWAADYRYRGFKGLGFLHRGNFPIFVKLWYNYQCQSAILGFWPGENFDLQEVVANGGIDEDPSFQHFPLGELAVNHLHFSIYHDIRKETSCLFALCDYMKEVYEVLRKMHKKYSLKDDGQRSECAPSMLIPSDCPLKAEKISFHWGDLLQDFEGNLEEFRSRFLPPQSEHWVPAYWSSGPEWGSTWSKYGCWDDSYTIVGWNWTPRFK